MVRTPRTHRQTPPDPEADTPHCGLLVWPSVVTFWLKGGLLPGEAPPYGGRAGGTRPTGMLSCFSNTSCIVVIMVIITARNEVVAR